MKNFLLFVPIPIFTLFIFVKFSYAGVCDPMDNYTTCLTPEQFQQASCVCFSGAPGISPWCWRLSLEGSPAVCPTDPNKLHLRYESFDNCDSLCGGGGVECFLPATKIKTPSGESNIESLKSGDKVLSFTPQGTMVENTVSTPITTTRDEYFEIKTKSGQIVKATAEHPFYIGEDKGIIGGIKDLAKMLSTRLLVIRNVL